MSDNTPQSSNHGPLVGDTGDAVYQNLKADKKSEQVELLSDIPEEESLSLASESRNIKNVRRKSVRGVSEKRIPDSSTPITTGVKAQLKQKAVYTNINSSLYDQVKPNKVNTSKSVPKHEISNFNPTDSSNAIKPRRTSSRQSE
jgi:isoleucyl-tRNA synthetase